MRQRAQTESSAKGEEHTSDTRDKPSSAGTEAVLVRRGSQHNGVHQTQDHKTALQSPFLESMPICPRLSELQEPVSPIANANDMNPTTIPAHILTSISDSSLVSKEQADVTPLLDISIDDAGHASTSLADPWQDHRQAYLDRPINPPITSETMLELESHRIINNPKLRYDVNFDKELQFRPNSDGAKGRQKAKDSVLYWKAIEWELRLIEDSILAGSSHKITLEWIKRIPAVFQAVRDILFTLVPEVEQARIIARLDIPFMTHQISHGVCDLHDLARWLAKVVKTHCAPMRDSIVNDFEDAVLGHTNTHELTSALAKLLNIMEAMKLDVANHQIRHMRPLLISNTVEFQKNYNAERRHHHKIDTNRAVMWLKFEIKNINTRDGIIVSPLRALCSALLWDIISPHGHEPYPSTFYLDFARLKDITAEVHMLIMGEICRGIAGREVPVSAIGLDVAHLAAEIARDSDHNLKEVQAQLNNAQASSPVYTYHKNLLFDRMLPKYQSWVHRCISMTALELHNALVPPPSRRSRPTGTYGATLIPARKYIPKDPDHGLLRRLTHLTVLHWQVWSDVYLQEISHDSSETAEELCDGNRDMLSILEDLGLLDLDHGQGTTVVPVEAEDMDLDNTAPAE